MDFNTNSSGGNVVYLTSLALVDSVGHTLVDVTLDSNINIISNLECGQEGSGVESTVLSKGTREEGSCSGTITETVGHGFEKE